MSPYRRFVFSSYSFDALSKTLELSYSFDDKVSFTERFRFDFAFKAYDEAVLDRAFQLLFFMAGVSYYKAFLPQNIEVRSGSIDTVTAKFLEKTWQRGLGEYWFVNDLDPNTQITFPINSAEYEPPAHQGDGIVIGLGGGKDSLVSVELLRESVPDVATWSMGHRSQLQPLVDRIGLPHYWVERSFDTTLLTHKNKTGYKNGHIPISAIFACVGTVVAILSGRRDYVVSNEHSANEPTLTYRGIEINHQYSKSQEFEYDFQHILKHRFGDSVRYYSLLRPFSEIRIAELFSEYFDTYNDVFCSCNRAFTLDSDRMSWDGSCSKCAFVFLALTPFIDQSKLEALFGDKNLLRNPDLQPTYRQLLGIEGNKPLECIGEVKESRAAMRLAFMHYPELEQVYVFDLLKEYNFRETYSHLIPADISPLISHIITR